MNRLDAAITDMPENLLKGVLANGRGRYCAVGWMAHRIGWTDDELQEEYKWEYEEGRQDGVAPEGRFSEPTEDVASMYGLNETSFSSEEIIQANDCGDGESRRTRVVAVLSKIREEMSFQLEAKRAK